jgi:hypothetical protein
MVSNTWFAVREAISNVKYSIELLVERIVWMF